jgi:hypothetical protein
MQPRQPLLAAQRKDYERLRDGAEQGRTRAAGVAVVALVSDHATAFNHRSGAIETFGPSM